MPDDTTRRTTRTDHEREAATKVLEAIDFLDDGDGADIDTTLRVMDVLGYDLGDVLHTVVILRDRGAVYEPRDGVLRVT